MAERCVQAPPAVLAFVAQAAEVCSDNAKSLYASKVLSTALLWLAARAGSPFLPKAL